MFDRSQMLKGTLEGCILKVIEQHTTYGYEIMVILKDNGFEGLTEGTIYPLLLRLEKQYYISAELKSSPLGPKRKYYSITDDGRAYLNEFRSYWEQLNLSINKILFSEDR